MSLFESLTYSEEQAKIKAKEIMDMSKCTKIELYSSDCICDKPKCPLLQKGFRPYAYGAVSHWKYSLFQGKTIVIEGNIGSGKSSMAKEMETFFNSVGIPAVYIPEYVDEELLTQFISDMKTHAYTFQLFMLEKRAEIYRRAIEMCKLGHVVIMDRMMYGDLVFAFHHFQQGNITATQFDSYRNKMQSFGFNHPAITFYLQVSPECAHRRAVKRNRKGETYTLSYFEEIDAVYKTILAQYKGEVIHVPYENDLLSEELLERAESLLQQAINFIL